MLAGWSYLLKRSVSDADALVRAIESAAAGFLVLDRQLTTHAQPKPSGPLSRLTPRQREILALMAQGFTNTAIAQRLVLTEKTVENQANIIYQKLGIERGASVVHPRVKAVLLYLQDSFLPHG